MNTLIVEICVGTSCHLRGSKPLYDAVDSLPTAKREWIDLRGVACLNCCRKGPSVRIAGMVYTGMTVERLLAMIDRCLVQGETGQAAGQ